MPDLLFFLLLGHFCGDFALQSDLVADRKRRSAAALSLHALSYTVVIALFLMIAMALRRTESIFNLTGLLVLIGLFIQHWLQDFLKSLWSNGGKQGFYIDQAIHIAVLYLIRIFIYCD